MRWEIYMKEAIREAHLGIEEGEVPVGAVLFTEDGRILARAHNRPRTLLDPTAHAEILVMRQAARALRNYRLPGTILCVTLEPCIMCFGAMVQARIGRLVFGARDPKGGALGGMVDLTRLARFNHHVQVTGGICVEECAGLLTGFFRQRRKRKKMQCGEVPKWS